MINNQLFWSLPIVCSYPALRTWLRLTLVILFRVLCPSPRARRIWQWIPHLRSLGWLQGSVATNLRLRIRSVSNDIPSGRYTALGVQQHYPPENCQLHTLGAFANARDDSRIQIRLPDASRCSWKLGILMGHPLRNPHPDHARNWVGLSPQLR
jgi:hypothetical protein